MRHRSRDRARRRPLAYAVARGRSRSRYRHRTVRLAGGGPRTHLPVTRVRSATSGSGCRCQRSPVGSPDRTVRARDRPARSRPPAAPRSVAARERAGLQPPKVSNVCGRSITRRLLSGPDRPADVGVGAPCAAPRATIGRPRRSVRPGPRPSVRGGGPSTDTCCHAGEVSSADPEPAPARALGASRRSRRPARHRPADARLAATRPPGRCDGCPNRPAPGASGCRVGRAGSERARRQDQKLRATGRAVPVGLSIDTGPGPGSPRCAGAPPATACT